MKLRAKPPHLRDPSTGFWKSFNNPRLHDAAVNALFCDGHVEVPKAQRLFFERSDDVLRRWNKDNEPHRELLP